MDKSIMEKYAGLVVKTGIKLQKGQLLVINTPIDCAEFARHIAQSAYLQGARDVVMNWSDEQFSKIRYMNAPEEIFEEFPEWRRKFYYDTSMEGAAYVDIYVFDPDAMSGVKPERMAKVNKTTSQNTKEYRERRAKNINPWCVVAVPTPAWAKKVFPDMPAEEAVEKLFDVIIKTVRVDKDDPQEAWKKHLRTLKEKIDILNKTSFKTLHLKNSIGTDLYVDLPEGHIWGGGFKATDDASGFIVNMPTEEVYTAPHRTGVNGTVVSSMPLNYNGSLIDKFSITYKDGRVISFTAEKGYDALKSIIEIDEGSHYLGEIALVTYDSPISQSGILFYNTLFDENASCHLAIGSAYPVSLENGENMTRDELSERGLNYSLTHVDFMFGTSDLDITGFTKDGTEIAIFRNGCYVI